MLQSLGAHMFSKGPGIKSFYIGSLVSLLDNLQEDLELIPDSLNLGSPLGAIRRLPAYSSTSNLLRPSAINCYV